MLVKIQQTWYTIFSITSQPPQCNNEINAFFSCKKSKKLRRNSSAQKRLGFKDFGAITLGPRNFLCQTFIAPQHLSDKMSLPKRLYPIQNTYSTKLISIFFATCSTNPKSKVLMYLVFSICFC